MVIDEWPMTVCNRLGVHPRYLRTDWPRHDGAYGSHSDARQLRQAALDPEGVPEVLMDIPRSAKHHRM
jgi:hypothetical protein